VERKISSISFQAPVRRQPRGEKGGEGRPLKSTGVWISETKGKSCKGENSQSSQGGGQKSRRGKFWSERAENNGFTYPSQSRQHGKLGRETGREVNQPQGMEWGNVCWQGRAEGEKKRMLLRLVIPYAYKGKRKRKGLSVAFP